jgi:hypothetical protein
VVGVLTCSDGVEFRRELAQLRPGVWELIDTFSGHKETALEWVFHFAPGLELGLHEEGHRVTVRRNRHPFVIVHIPDGGVQPQVRDSWYSHRYGAKQSNRQLYARWQGEFSGQSLCFRWQFQLVNHSHLPTEVLRTLDPLGG